MFNRTVLSLGLVLSLPAVAMDQTASSSSSSSSSHVPRQSSSSSGASSSSSGKQPNSKPDAYSNMSKEEFSEFLNSKEPSHSGVKTELKEWQIRLSVANMPRELQARLKYFQKLNASGNLNLAHHYFVLVGTPGVGKTIMARAFAAKIGYEVVYFKITHKAGSVRGKLTDNLRDIFDQVRKSGKKTVIILDELHDLYRDHQDSSNDRQESSSALVGHIDDLLESGSGQIVIIGTANDVSEMPDNLMNRFEGKRITVPAPSKEYKKQLFNEIIANNNIAYDASINNNFIDRFLEINSDFVLRDIQSVFDRAEIEWLTTSEEDERFTISAALLELTVNKMREEKKRNGKKKETPEEARNRMHREMMEQNYALQQRAEYLRANERACAQAARVGQWLGEAAFGTREQMREEARIRYVLDGGNLMDYNNGGGSCTIQ